MTTIRDNPPSSIIEDAELAIYQSLYDDMTSNGSKLRFDDRYALADLAVSIVLRDKCAQNVRINGTVLEVAGDKGSTVTKKNPDSDLLCSLNTHIFRLLKEFKLTPTSRGKHVSGVENQKQEDGWGEI